MIARPLRFWRTSEGMSATAAAQKAVLLLSVRRPFVAMISFKKRREALMMSSRASSSLPGRRFRTASGSTLTRDQVNRDLRAVEGRVEGGGCGGGSPVSRAGG